MRKHSAVATVRPVRTNSATALVVNGNWQNQAAKKHNPQKLAFLRIAFVWSGVCVDAVGAALQSEKGSYGKTQ